MKSKNFPSKVNDRRKSALERRIHMQNINIGAGANPTKVYNGEREINALQSRITSDETARNKRTKIYRGPVRGA